MLEEINTYLPDNISAVGVAFVETEQVEAGLHISSDWVGTGVVELDVLSDIQGDALRIYTECLDNWKMEYRDIQKRTIARLSNELQDNQ
jgi:hypothetical protein